MAQVGISIGVGLALQLIGSALTPPSTIGKLENKNLPESSYGARFSYGYGTFLVRGILIAAPDEYTEERTRRGKIGGKTIEYTYSATLAFALCRNQIQAIVQLKLNGDAVIDFLSGDDLVLESSTEFYDDLILRFGTQTQGTVAALDLVNSPNVPYRGIAYFTLPDFDLTEKYGNRPPLAEALVSTNATIDTGEALILVHRPLELVHTIDPPPSTGDLTISATDIDTNYTTAAGRPTPDGITSRLYEAEAFAASRFSYVEFVLSEEGDSSVEVNATNPLTIGLDSGNIEIYQDPQNKTIAPFVGGHSVRVDWVDSVTAQVQIDGVDIGPTFNLGSSSPQIIATIGTPAFFTYATRIARNVTSVSISNVSLASILDNICQGAGINCDTSELDDQILGIDLRGDSPKEQIEQLQQIFGFFSVDTGNSIKFLNGIRPPAVRTFATLDDFGLINARPYTWDQKQLSELPYEIEVTHYDILEEKEINQYWRRDSQGPNEAPSTQNKIQINTGATMTPAAAIGIAEMTAARIWQEREQFTLTTTIENADLEPGDTIILPYLGEPQEFLITAVSFGANFIVEISAVRYDRSPWERKKTPVFEGRSTIPQDPYHSKMVIAQIPRISTTHPIEPIYWAASQSRPVWRTCQLLGSADDGASFIQISETINPGCVGVTLSALALAETGSFRVRVSSELNTITAALFNGANQANWLLVGSEIIKFRTATLISNIGQYSYYTLSTLQRGLNGTTAVDHPIYSQVALVAHFSVFDRNLVGVTGETVQFQPYFDGIESRKIPYEYELL